MTDESPHPSRSATGMTEPLDWCDDDLGRYAAERAAKMTERLRAAADGKSTDRIRGELFGEHYAADVRYCTPWDKWLIWTGTHWRIDDALAIEDRAVEFIGELHAMAAQTDDPSERQLLGHAAHMLESRRCRQTMILDARCQMTIPPDYLDADPWLLTCANGTLDLRTGELRRHSRGDCITRLIDIDYDAAAACPTWDTFLRQVFLGDEGLIQFVQRAAGYSLTGLTREQVLFILWGLGANGKTTLMGALSGLLGPYAATAPPDLLLARRGDHHPTELAALHGARLVTAAETGDGRRLAESLVKQLTGSDRIAARRMREDYWTFNPTHKVWGMTNHRPEIRGTDHAIWRRIRLIPFRATFHPPESGQTPAQDPELPERLRAELPGILSWAVRGCCAWQRDGLGMADAVRDATAAYRAEMDVLGRWLDECCVIEPRAEAGASELYRSYAQWCESVGERAESQRGFGLRLSERGYTKQRDRKARGYRGIGLICGAYDVCDRDSSISAIESASRNYKEKGVTTDTSATPDLDSPVDNSGDGELGQPLKRGNGADWLATLNSQTTEADPEILTREQVEGWIAQIRTWLIRRGEDDIGVINDAIAQCRVDRQYLGWMLYRAVWPSAGVPLVDTTPPTVPLQ